MATEWSHGYPVDEVYPPAWHPFQSPAHIRAACAIAGVAWEVGAETPLSICDLGCGTGYTASVIAAGGPAWSVLGLDYNPAHIAEARSLATAAGLPNMRFEEADLTELDEAALDRLPMFDMVMVHGVWSWVDDRVRAGVLRFLRSRVKPGGVVVMTYNCLPGAAAGIGLARLVRGALLDNGALEARIATARERAKALQKAEARHLLPSGWLGVLTGEAGNAREGYLLHEFMTAHWRPAFFADVAAAMGEAKLEYVGSATLDENVPAMTLSPEQREIWDAQPDVANRELVKDFCVIRAFRRDIYVRGARGAWRDAAVDALVLASASAQPGPRKLAAQGGTAELPPHILDPMRAALAQRPHSVAELRALPGCGTTTPTETLVMLVGSGCAVPLWQLPGTGLGWDEAVATARRFNAVSAARYAPHAMGGGARLALATPALGGGLLAEKFELGIAALIGAHPEVLEIRGEDVGVDLPALLRLLLPPETPPKDVLDNLIAEAVKLIENRLPVWRALGIA